MKTLRKHLATIVTVLVLFCSINLYAQEHEKLQRNPETTEVWKPVPQKVFPDGVGQLPSDAIVLFDGRNLDAWESSKGGSANWPIMDSFLTEDIDLGDVKTKQSFGDCQLHIEWRIVLDIVGEGQHRGNSGVLLQGRYEIQVLESFDSQTYVNGQAGAIYKQKAPEVNACKKPGEWQVYDIVFTAPRFNEKGRAIVPARLTVLQNGVVIQNNSEIWGTDTFIGMPQYYKHNLKEPLVLQSHPNDHKNPVQFRNIWIREL